MPITWEKSDGHLRGASEHTTYYVTRDFSTQRWSIEYVHNASGLRRAVPGDFVTGALAQMWCNKFDHDHEDLRTRIDGYVATAKRAAADALVRQRAAEVDEEQRFWDAAFQSALARTPGESNVGDVVLAEDCANLAVQRRRARIEAERMKLEEERTKEP